MPARLSTTLILIALVAGRALAGADPIPAAINQLGIDLLHAQRADGAGNANLLLSPYSIETALAMAYVGADGATREEMQRVLHLPADDTDVSAGFALLARQLRELQESSRHRADELRKQGVVENPIEINVANRLFAQVGYAFLPAFTTALREQFAAPLEELDFVHAAESSRLTINTWVARETRDKIRDLVPADALGADTRMVLANAVYLKAPWEHTFDPSATKPDHFWAGGKTPVDVPTMLERSTYGLKKHATFTAVALPYGGGELQFLILLPSRRDGLEKLERTITPELLDSFVDLPRRDVNLHLPKFELEPPSMSLGELLRGLGMKTGFDQPAGSANFDRMAPRKPDEHLAISEVLHQAWLALDEDGTEAAAATTTVLATLGGPPPPPVEVRVDHPFLFAIQHVPSGACLFLGRVVDPR